MSIKSVAKNILGFSQFNSLDPTKRKVVLGISIATAATIIGIPFAPFVYRFLVAIFSKESPENHSKVGGIREKTFGQPKESNEDLKRLRTLELKRRNDLEKFLSTLSKKVSRQEDAVESGENKSWKKALLSNGFVIFKEEMIPPMKIGQAQKIAIYNERHRSYALSHRKYGEAGVGMNLRANDNFDEKIKRFEETIQEAKPVAPSIVDILNDHGFWIIPGHGAFPNKKEGKELLIAENFANGGFKLIYISANAETQNTVSFFPEEGDLKEKFRKLTSRNLVIEENAI